MPQPKKRTHRKESQFATQIGTRVQFLRLERGLSLRQVAERGDVRGEMAVAHPVAGS